MAILLGTTLHAGSCDKEVRRFWQNIDGLGEHNFTKEQKNIYFQAIQDEFNGTESKSIHAQIFKMTKMFGGEEALRATIFKPHSTHLKTVRIECGGTTYEMRDAAREADIRFKEMYVRWEIDKQESNKNHE